MTDRARLLVRVVAFMLGVPVMAAVVVSDSRTAAAWSNTINLDQRAALTPLDQIVPEIERECHASAHVTLRVRTQRPSEIRADLAAAAHATQESPEHWTLVEAVTIAVECPRQLPALYRIVSRAGEPEAAATAKARVQQASKGLTER
jgi:hypothetical protein